MDTIMQKDKSKELSDNGSTANKPVIPSDSKDHPESEKQVSQKMVWQIV